jgi:hypothetical protein
MSLDFTHFNLTIEDIKKIKAGRNGNSPFYKIKFKEFTKVISVTAEIFDNRVCAYFMKSSMDLIHRNDLLSCKFNVHATDGYFLRVLDTKLSKHQGKYDSTYVNFIDVAGAILNAEGPYFSKYESSNAAIEA